MNEKIQALLERRSIRSYKEEQISEEELNTILKAGLYAPSGMGEFKWKFVVVQNGNPMNKLLQVLKEELGLSENVFYHAPTLVMVFADKDSCAPVEDGSLALGNMLNASHMIGLGSCWIHAIPHLFKKARGKELQKEYNVPENYICVGSCVIGYRKDNVLPTPKPRDNSIIIKVQ